MSDQIFISYRRNDAAYVTGHINDLLRNEFGDEAVFTDVDNIALGVDFRAVIDETVSQCQVFLAVIGTDWLSARDHDGNPRLNDPADFVRIEVESALKRNIPVIPLLVSGATMPTAEDLPETLKDLAYRNGTPIRPAPDFSADMARLIKNLRKHFDTQRSSAGATATPPGADEPESVEKPPVQQAKRNEKAPGAHIHVAEDESARKRAELGIGQQKKRGRATMFWALAVAIGAVGGWYFVDQNPAVLEGLMSSTPAKPSSNPAAETVNPDVATDSPSANVPAPTSFAPATVTDAGEAPDPAVSAGGIVDIETEATPIIDSAVTAIEAAADNAQAEAGAVADALSENIEALTDDAATTFVPGMEAADAPADPPSEPETVAAESVSDSTSLADREVTLTPGSQRQSDASSLISDGVRLAGVGDHEAAIQNFSEALSLEVEPAFVYKQRGASYQALGQYAAAVQDYNQSIELNSEDPITIYNRGVSHIALQDFAAAVTDFDSVIALDPEYVDAYARRADAHEALGNAEAATRDRAVVSVFDSNQSNPR